MEGEFDSDDHDHEEEEMVEEEEDEAVVDEAGSNNVDSEAEISEPVFEQHVEAESVDQGQSDNEGFNEATSDAGDVETAVELVNVGAESSFMQLFSGVDDVPADIQSAVIENWRNLRAELDEARPRLVGDPNRENLGNLKRF